MIVFEKNALTSPFLPGRHHAAAHARRDRPADDPRRLRGADPVPAPQPVAAEHVPVRHGQAGDRLDRLQPADADGYAPVPAGLSCETVLRIY
jgi:hypothetical protein